MCNILALLTLVAETVMNVSNKGTWWTFKLGLSAENVAVRIYDLLTRISCCCYVTEFREVTRESQAIVMLCVRNHGILETLYRF